MGRHAVEIPTERLKEFCKKWKIVELSFFGSVLRGDFREESDVDILVSWSKEVCWGLLEHVRMEEELSEIFQRKVDLVSRRAIEKSENWLRRKTILESAEIFYAA